MTKEQLDARIESMGCLNCYDSDGYIRHTVAIFRDKELEFLVKLYQAREPQGRCVFDTGYRVKLSAELNAEAKFYADNRTKLVLKMLFNTSTEAQAFGDIWCKAKKGRTCEIRELGGRSEYFLGKQE
jgi:hypothetical protein